VHLMVLIVSTSVENAHAVLSLMCSHASSALMANLRLTEAEFEAIKRNIEGRSRGNDPTKYVSMIEFGSCRPMVSEPKQIYRSRLEQEFALILEAWRLRGELKRWEYETITLQLGEKCRFTPDFSTFSNDGHLMFYEVKGKKRWDDAMAKIRSAATKYPEFRFSITQKIDGEWDFYEFTPLPSGG
jgi:hypothetical protein